MKKEAARLRPASGFVSTAPTDRGSAADILTIRHGPDNTHTRLRRHVRTTARQCRGQGNIMSEPQVPAVTHHNPTLEAALYYAETLGWQVLPVHSVDNE